MRVVVRARSLRGRSRPCNGTKDIEDLDNPQATETHLTTATKAVAGVTRGHLAALCAAWASCRRPSGGPRTMKVGAFVRDGGRDAPFSGKPSKRRKLAVYEPFVHGPTGLTTRGKGSTRGLRDFHAGTRPLRRSLLSVAAALCWAIALPLPRVLAIDIAPVT